MRTLLIILTLWVVGCSIAAPHVVSRLEDRILSERAVVTPESYEARAHCIAEMSYQNPMTDRFDELVNALRLCRQQEGQP